MEAGPGVCYRLRQMAMVQTQPVGSLLRQWRERRRLSQLDLALDAEISTRHLSFVETGRSAPSREMVIRLAERLNVPLRERNALLVAAGFAPVYQERSLDDPALEAARRAVDFVLERHEPYPALAVDRHWIMRAANQAARSLLSGLDPELLVPPVNVLRVSLHPKGMSPMIVNLTEWREHLLMRLSQQIELTADPVLEELHKELSGYPTLSPGPVEASRKGLPEFPAPNAPVEALPSVLIPIQLRTEFGILSMFSTTTVFATPIDITLSELALELFYPADSATASALQSISREQ